MALISSPIAYPPSSSPPEATGSRKRCHADAPTYPTKRVCLGNNGKDTGNPQFRIPPSVTLKPTGLETTSSKTHALVKAPGPFLDDNDEDDAFDGNSVAPAWPATANEEPPMLQPLPPVRKYQALLDPERRSPHAQTSSGKSFAIRSKHKNKPLSDERLIAGRSTTEAGRATKSFYGIDIHNMFDQAIQEAKQAKAAPQAPSIDTPRPTVEVPAVNNDSKKSKNLLWTEKYRARKFTDLVGDERTHRDVLRWLKGWDPIIFPGNSKAKRMVLSWDQDLEVKPHKKILLITGPPGLGKTTLAHVCARQAGYEVVEINASDERSRDVVNGKIKDCVGTENVKGVNTKTAEGKVRKAGRPVCVIVDEVDGVVSGSSGGGEGGFIRALIDLATLDQKNSNSLGSTSANLVRATKKGDKFRLLRPMVLICNDVYHPALRPLRSSSMAETIHIRRPPLDKVVARLKSVFDQECVSCDGDGVRRLCEATWGMSNERESRNSNGSGEGDMRGILVVGEWVASKLRASAKKDVRLTKKWVEENMIGSLSHGGGGTRGIGRGGAKEAVERVFIEGAGFAKPIPSMPNESASRLKHGDSVDVSNTAKRLAIDRLQEIVDASGESDRIVTDCFASYPSRPFQDDTFLSKPNNACDWLHFHDRISSKVHIGQEWELGPYLSQCVLGFHHLFASTAKQSWGNDQKRWDDEAEEEPLPFTGPRAHYSASEGMKQNRSILQGLQSSLTIPLYRSFRSIEDISTDLLPHLIKMLTPDVKPIVVGGSGDQSGIVSVRKHGEREMIQRAVGVMGAVGVHFEKTRLDVARSGVSSHIYRMEP